MFHNRLHIPQELNDPKGREVSSSVWCFTESKDILQPVTLQAFCPKKNKILFFLSTQHEKEEYVDDLNQLSSINSYYNETKGTIDTFDYIV